MWEQIKILCPDAMPANMILDFVIGAINILLSLWPFAELKGCFFHLSQNIWRKVQELRLQAHYIQDKALVLRIRLLPALAFASQFDFPQAQDLSLYFEKTYVGRSLPEGAFVESLFPKSLWNHHNEVPQGIPHTTNAIEAWHRSYNVTIGCCHHPNIWKFLVALQRE